MLPADVLFCLERILFISNHFSQENLWICDVATFRYSLVCVCKSYHHFNLSPERLKNVRFDMTIVLRRVALLIS